MGWRISKTMFMITVTYCVKLLSDPIDDANVMMTNYCLISTMASAGLCFILGVVCLVLLAPEFIDPIIIDQLKLHPSSPRIADWLQLPVKPITNVYLFTVVNHVDMIEKGAAPVFRQMGPYAYEETIERVGVEWHTNGTVSFQPKHTYRFRRDLSVGDDTDQVRTLNMVMVSAAEAASHLPSYKRFALLALIKFNKFGWHSDALVTLSVKDLLWGHYNSLYDFARANAGGAMQTPPHELFGLFAGKNNSQDFSGRYTVSTGENGIVAIVLAPSSNSFLCFKSCI